MATPNEKIYELIDGLRLEIKDDIKAVRGEIVGLRQDFMEMEKGRLTRLEGEVRDLKVGLIRKGDELDKEQAVLSAKMMIGWGAILVVANIVGTIGIAYLLKRLIG